MTEVKDPDFTKGKKNSKSGEDKMLLLFQITPLGCVEYSSHNRMSQNGAEKTPISAASGIKIKQKD